MNVFMKHEKPPLREFNYFLLCYTGAKLRKIIGSASDFPKKLGKTITFLWENCSPY